MRQRGLDSANTDRSGFGELDHGGVSRLVVEEADAQDAGLDGLDRHVDANHGRQVVVLVVHSLGHKANESGH